MSSVQDFSARDSVLALLSPLSCCLPQPNTIPADPDAPWYSPNPPDHRSQPQHYQWQPSDPSSRPSDLLSLHSNPAGRRRARRGGGDVSGSGGNDGSGLSRWTLVKAWWTWDAKGRIRLEESEDGSDAGERRDVEELGVEQGEDDAVPLSQGQTADLKFLRRLDADIQEDSFERPAPPSAYDQDDNEALRQQDKVARRARRHARGRARELGLTIEEFDEGVAVGEIPPPDEEDVTGYLSASQGRHCARSVGASSSGESSRSGSRRHRQQDQPEHQDYHQDSQDLQPPPRERRHRHRKRESVSASFENPSEAHSAGTSRSSHSHRSSSSTLATTVEEPRTPYMDDFTEEDWETASARSGKRRSKSQRRRERELSRVQEGEAEAEEGY